MNLIKVLVNAKRLQPLRRGGDQDPTLRYRIVRNSADLQLLIADNPRLESVRSEGADRVPFPLLLEIWDGGFAWSPQIDLEAALSEDWELG